LRSPNETKVELLRRAAAVGFDDCRIAPVAAPRYREEFHSWLEAGYAAEMDWIARGAEKRSDPQKVLPGARSVIVLALNYWQGEEKCGTRTAEYEISAAGRIARYAWGDDYHELMEKKLGELDSYLTAAGGQQ